MNGKITWDTWCSQCLSDCHARELESARRISITLIEAREINGRYTGSLQGLEQGSVATKDYFL